MKTKLIMAAAACALAIGACARIADPPQQQANQFTNVAGSDAPIRLAYRDEGKGSPLLMLHGFGANIYTWRAIEPALAKHHRVISVDLKGFGQSDKPFDDQYSVFDQAKLIGDFIVSKNLKNLTVVGHSFGGGVALLLAMDERPQLKRRIKRLVLIDTIAYPQKIPVFFKILRTPVANHVSTRVTPPYVQARTALRIAYYNDDMISFQDVAAYAQPLTTPGGKHALIETAKSIDLDDFKTITEGYGSIKQPALIIWCDHDKVVPEAVGRKLHATMPRSTFRQMKSCGHLPHEEKPEETASAILAFLQR
jgi:pimeloyl-ACP methyl ester carboxylesterase